jgi:hypothetical protein
MFVSPHAPSKALGDELATIITKAGTWTPRSKQIYIGPSEIGHECTRRIAYKLLDWDKPNEMIGGGNWSAQVGTAIHAHLADIFGKLEQYEVEQRVTIRGNLAGTIDLFDKERGIVMDWKTTGSTGLQTRRKEGATKQQLVQVQLYGYGKKQEGAEVNQVALIYLPTSGSLDEMHVELHDYDEETAMQALERLDNVYQLITSVDVENSPDMWGLIPATPSRLCNYCPYFQPFSTELAKACNGDTNV